MTGTGDWEKARKFLTGHRRPLYLQGLKGIIAGKIQLVHADPSYELVDVMEELFDQQIVSVLVEGGAELLQSFSELRIVG